MATQNTFKIGDLEIHSIFSPLYLGIKNYYEYNVSKNGEDITSSIYKDKSLSESIEAEIERLNGLHK